MSLKRGCSPSAEGKLGFLGGWVEAEEEEEEEAFFALLH